VDGNALKARRRRGKNEARGAATATFSAWHSSPTSLLTVISPVEMAGLALAILAMISLSTSFKFYTPTRWTLPLLLGAIPRHQRMSENQLYEPRCFSRMEGSRGRKQDRSPVAD
jgi:hypothetical protein